MRTTCVIAGGGPAGAMLALLLARAGVDVTLLEKHADFLRDFRGDTIHPSTLQVLDEIGLAEAFHRLPHRKAYRMAIETDDARIPIADLSRLRGRYRYIAFVPQWDFLDLITAEAAGYPNFRLLMSSRVTGLIVENGVVRGVRYRDESGGEQGGDQDGGGRDSRDHEIRATLTVAADGRGSDLRRAAGLRPREFGAPMDVVWFRLSRRHGDPEQPFLRASAGHLMVAINREQYWQLAYLIPKGGYDELQSAGIEELRRTIARLLPFLAGRVDELRGFDDAGFLRVAVNRLTRWHRPGLLLIGDAAHAMSPVFGVGINLAVQDAVAAANIVGPALLRGEAPEALLARVQRRRALPTAITQTAQRVVQRLLIRRVLRSGRRQAPPSASGPASRPRLRGFRPPRIRSSQLPVIGGLARRFIGHGVLPEHVRLPARQKRSH